MTALTAIRRLPAWTSGVKTGDHGPVRRLWTACACVLLGCGRLSFGSLSDAGGLDDLGTIDDAPDAPVDACTLGPWSARVPITAANTSSNEWAPTLSADGLTLLFSSDRDGDEDIYISVRSTTADPFPAPSPVTELNSTAIDTSPVITRDGRSVYFTSNRNAVTSELFVASRDPVTGAIGAPALVPEFAGTAIYGPTFSADENELIYGLSLLRRATRGMDGMFAVEGPVTELNVDGDGFPSLSTDGTTLYFASQRSGLLGIYSATRSGPGAPFGAITQIDVLGGGGPDDPEISADDRMLLFVASSGGNYDLYMSTRDCM